MVRTARPVKRVAAPATAKPAAKPAARASRPTKVVAKEAEAAPAKVARPAKVVVKSAPASTRNPVEGDGFAGFRAGSGAELAAKALIEGGKSRTDIMRQLRDDYPDESKNWSVTISTVASALFEKGYTDEGHYRMIPPPGTNGAPKKVAPVRRARPARKLVTAPVTTGSGRTTPAKPVARTTPRVVSPAAKTVAKPRPRARSTSK